MATPPISTPPKSNNPFAPRRYGVLQQVTDSVFIIRNITNSSFVIGDRSVAVIDTQVNASSASELLRLIRTVTKKPIEFVINTHYHWDHTNGNALFKKEGATVISSAMTKKFMVERAPRQKEFLSGRGFELGEDPFLPEKTFEGETEIDLGNMPLRLFYAGSAETEDATAVHVLHERVVMSGDTVMTGSFPIFGQPVWDEGLEGDDRWLRTLDVLMSLRAEHIIPGHGPLAQAPEVELLIRTQHYFIEEVGALVKKGLDVKAVLSDLEAGLPKWITDMPIVWGTPRYAILRVFRGLTKKPQDIEPGWQTFKPSAIPTPKKSGNIPSSDSVEGYRQMASEAREGGDSGLEIAILKKASLVFPSSCDILAGYADALIEASKREASVLEKGDFFQEARIAWDRALAMDAVHIPSLLGKGRYLTMMAYRGGDDPSEGMRYLRKVIELKTDPRVQAEAEFYLGMGLRRLGNEMRAKAQFQKALMIDPSFVPAAMAAQA